MNRAQAANVEVRNCWISFHFDTELSSALPEPQSLSPPTECVLARTEDAIAPGSKETDCADDRCTTNTYRRLANHCGNGKADHTGGYNAANDENTGVCTLEIRVISFSESFSKRIQGRMARNAARRD